MLHRTRLLIARGGSDALLPAFAKYRYVSAESEPLALWEIVRELNDYWLGEEDPDILFEELLS